MVALDIFPFLTQLAPLHCLSGWAWGASSVEGADGTSCSAELWARYCSGSMAKDLQASALRKFSGEILMRRLSHVLQRADAAPSIEQSWTEVGGRSAGSFLLLIWDEVQPARAHSTHRCAFLVSVSVTLWP